MPWWQYAREHYLSIHNDELPKTTTMYYDPIVNVHHVVPATMGQVVAWYAGPQVPEDARRLFEAGVASAGLDAASPSVPLNASRMYAAALALSREWEMPDLEERLAEAIEASYEPTWEAASGEFTWGLGLDEPHPRGQYNAFLAAAEANGPQMWERLSAAPLEPCPQVVGVDFPAVAMTRAEWINDSLFLSMSPLKPDPSKRTTFRIVGAEPRLWDYIGIEGAMLESTASALVVTVPLVEGDMEFCPSSY